MLVSAIQDVKQINLNFDFIVIGASVRYGRYSHQFIEFMKINLVNLIHQKHGFFSVSATARKPGRDQPSSDPYFQKIKTCLNWHPHLVGIFSGAINYSKYPFFDRFMIWLIMYLTHGPTNLSQPVEFTNWEKFHAFAIQIHILLNSYQNHACSI